MLHAALSAGLASEGVQVIDVGVLPTPALAWIAADRRVPAAMISGSHNGYADNGIKLLSASGTKLPDAVEAAIEEEMDLMALQRSRGEPLVGPAGPAVGTIETDPAATGPYCAHVLSVLAGSDGLAGFHVALDCANGAASVLGPQIFERAGARVSVIEATPDGVNINAGCGSTDPARLSAAVKEVGADLGLAFDGDADRVIAIDENGEQVDGDYLIAMFARDMAERGELSGQAVVVTVMSNLGLRTALAEDGIAVHETPVGDRYVNDALEAHGLVLGGEPSGHILFRRHATTGDGILTGVLLLDLLARKGKSLAELARSSMTRLPQILESVPVVDPSRLGAAARVWEEVSRIEEALDGRGRVLLRPSGTEARVRVMVEAPTEEEARSSVDHLIEVVRREIGSASP